MAEQDLMPNNARNLAGALTSMKIDELIFNLAKGVAEGQMKLDMACMEIAEFMGKARINFGKKADGKTTEKLSPIELGFTPTFYQFVDTILDIRVSLSTQYEERREMEQSDTTLTSSQYEEHVDFESKTEESSGENQSGSQGGSRNDYWWGGDAHSNWSSGFSSQWEKYKSESMKASANLQAKGLNVTTVDAKYASTYNYSAEAASSIKTKIVPVPPPEVFEEMIKAMVERRKKVEARMEMADDAGRILVDVMASIEKVLVLEGKTGIAASLDAAVSEISANYGRLKTEHFALGNTLEARKSSHESLQGINELNGEFKLVQAERKGKASDSALLTQLYAKAKEFKSGLETIKSALSAPVVGQA